MLRIRNIPLKSRVRSRQTPMKHTNQKSSGLGFPGGAVVKNPLTNARDTG